MHVHANVHVRANMHVRANVQSPQYKGTAEVESALVEHPACAEAAVVGVEHPIKGMQLQHQAGA